jgi:hypothetical protein
LSPRVTTTLASAAKIGELGGGRLSSKIGATAKKRCVPAVAEVAGAKYKINLNTRGKREREEGRRGKKLRTTQTLDEC